MSALAASPLQRTRLLRALGLTPWVLRSSAESAAVAEPAFAAPAAAGQAVACVVVLPAGRPARELDLLGRALHAFGPALARAARIEVQGERLAAVPEARAYLVFGEAQAHALGRELSAEAMHRAHIALADEPAMIFAAAAKRRLWHALRSLRRALAVER